jgi:hypothetical protein
MLAVVGSRNATTQGERDAEAFSKVLGDAGLTIVSGLALGIDAAAHRGGLATAAGTVAVIGTGADRLYPARNEALARGIAEKGVVLSEFPLGTPAIGGQFPAPQPHHRRARTRLPGDRGGAAQWFADHGTAGGRKRARGVRDSRLDPLAAVARLPPTDSPGRQAGRIGAGHPRGAALGTISGGRCHSRAGRFRRRTKARKSRCSLLSAMRLCARHAFGAQRLDARRPSCHAAAHGTRRPCCPVTRRPLPKAALRP